MVLVLDGAVVDLDRRVVERSAGPVRLTATEVALLAYLAARPGCIVGRDELTREVWGYHARVVTRAVDAAVKRLRKKIEEEPSNPRHLVSTHGAGYAFHPKEAPPPPPPAPTGRLIGRAAVSAAIARAFDEGERCVALVGPPGVGKTRVASAWATGSDVAWVAAGAEVRAPAAARIVLDGLVDPAALADWRARAPSSRILVTSTTHLRGIARIEVAPLPPDDAVELFLDRAGPVPDDPDFRAAVRELVQHLDGLPLAIELAASRVAVLPPRTLLERLDRRFEVLVDPRGASLEACFRAATAGLGPEQRAAFAGCATFGSAFTLEDAEAVLPDPALPRLDELVAASLLQAERRGDGTARFRMLESLRAFARGQPEWTTDARLRHARWTLSRSEAAVNDVSARAELRAELLEVCLVDPPELAARAALALQPLLSSRGTPAAVVAALETAADADGVPVDVRARALLVLATERSALGPAQDGLPLLERAIALLGPAPTDLVLLGRLRSELGTVETWAGRYERALEQLRIGVDLLRLHATAVAAQRYLARALDALAVGCWRTGRVAEARAAQEEALRVARALKAPDLEGDLLANRALLHLELGDAELAAEALDRALACPIEDDRWPVYLRAHRAIAGVELGDPGAGEALRTARKEALALRYGRISTLCTINLVVAALDRGELLEADLRAEEALAEVVGLGSPFALGVTRWIAGLVRAERGHTDDADRLYAAAAEDLTGHARRTVQASHAALLGADGRPLLPPVVDEDPPPTRLAVELAHATVALAEAVGADRARVAARGRALADRPAGSGRPLRELSTTVRFAIRTFVRLLG